MKWHKDEKKNSTSKKKELSNATPTNLTEIYFKGILLNSTANYGLKQDYQI